MYSFFYIAYTKLYRLFFILIVSILFY